MVMFARSLFVHGCRVFQDRLGHYPLAVFIHTEEAAVAARVAGDAGFVPLLRHFEQNHVVVAIQADLVDGLHVAGLLALEPQLAARAAEIHRPARFRRLLQGLAVHPGEHQHVIGALFLGDHGHQPLGVPFHVVKPVHGLIVAEPAAGDSQADRNSPFRHAGLGLAHGVLAVVEDAGREHRVGAALLHACLLYTSPSPRDS